MGIEPTTSGLLDQRRSRSDNQAPSEVQLDIIRSRTSEQQGSVICEAQQGEISQ